MTKMYWEDVSVGSDILQAPESNHMVDPAGPVTAPKLSLWKTLANLLLYSFLPAVVSFGLLSVAGKAVQTGILISAGIFILFFILLCLGEFSHPERTSRYAASVGMAAA